MTKHMFVIILLATIPAFSQVKLNKAEANLLSNLRQTTQISLAASDSLQKLNLGLGEKLTKKDSLTLSKSEAKFVYDYIIVPRQEELMLVSVLQGKLVQGKPLDSRERQYILDSLPGLFTDVERVINLMRTIVKQDSSVVN